MDLQVQLKVFDEHREEDFYEFAQRFDNMRLDLDDMGECFDVLRNSVSETSSEPFLLSILQHLLFIRDDPNVKSVFAEFLFFLSFRGKSLIAVLLKQILIFITACNWSYKLLISVIFYYSNLKKKDFFGRGSMFYFSIFLVPSNTKRDCFMFRLPLFLFRWLDRVSYYKLIEECVAQVVLHKSGCDPDFSLTKRFQIDVEPLIETLAERSKMDGEVRLGEINQKLEDALTAKQEYEAKLAHADQRIQQLEQHLAQGISLFWRLYIEPSGPTFLHLKLHVGLFFIIDCWT